MADKKWVVTADRLYTLHPDGKGDPRRQQPHFRGEVLTGLSDDDVERFVRVNAIAPQGSDAAKAAQNPVPLEVVHPSEEIAVADTMAAAAVHDAAAIAAGAAAVATEADDTDEVDEVVRPPKSATKPVLVAYFVESGQLTEDEAQAKSRNDLRNLLK